MNSFFFPKLALTNLKKNKGIYLPYIIACVFTVSFFYMVLSIVMNPGIGMLRGADIVQFVMLLGSVVIAIFSCILLFYTNGFLMKRRKKELGLYSVLGMEKKHVGKVFFWETFFTSLISIGGGILVGLLFNKLVFLILLRFIKYSDQFQFGLSKGPIIATIILFAVIFLGILFMNQIRIKVSSPMELFRTEETGEGEPKVNIFSTVLGILSLGGGYLIAIFSEKPKMGTFLFFLIAVLLVILGTYLLFSAGSIALLKVFKKNERFYYQTNHFISVSGMMHRMKQNARGLATICILSTMVLVSVAGTFSLYIGTEDALLQNYPSDFSVYLYGTNAEEMADLKTEVRHIAETGQYKGFELYSFTQSTLYGIIENDEFKEDESANFNIMIRFIDVDSLNKDIGTNYQLAEDELIISDSHDSRFFDYEWNTISCFGRNRANTI